MSDKDKVIDITLRMIAQLEQDKPSNLLMAVRTHYDLWQSELIVLLKQRNLPVHQFLSQLLKECGYEKATADKVRSYMSLVAKSKKTTKQKNIAELGITTPIAISGQKGDVVPPVVSMPGATPINGATAAVVSPKPMAVSATQSLPVGQAYSFKTALTRLRTEPRGTPWNEFDDELHKAFLDLCKERGAISIKELRHYLKDNEQSKKDCLFQYMAKIDITKKVFN